MHTGRCSTPFAAGSIDDNERQKKKEKNGIKEQKKKQNKTAPKNSALDAAGRWLLLSSSSFAFLFIDAFGYSVRLGPAPPWKKTAPDADA